jgi:hypothetical protein
LRRTLERVNWNRWFTSMTLTVTLHWLNWTPWSYLILDGNKILKIRKTAFVPTGMVHHDTNSLKPSKVWRINKVFTLPTWKV